MMRYLMIASLLMAGPVLFESLTTYSLGSSVLAAEEKKREKRRISPLRERTYKVLGESNVLIDPGNRQAEEGEELPEMKADPTQAVKILRKYLENRGNNAYEVAQIWNTLAYAYYTLGDTPKTMDAYLNVLKQPQKQISVALEMSALRALFQLYYADENYKTSIAYMDRWEALNAKPDPNVAFIKASAYYELEDFRKSLAQVKLVEKIVIEQERKMKENWLYLYVVVYNELKDYDNVIRILERLVVEFPKKQYWMHLAGMYAEKDLEDRSLSAYYAAYVQGMFVKETEIVMLAQRLLNAFVPIESAKVLEKGFKAELVEENEKNIRILATAYTMAQEHTKAIKTWQRATQYAEDGEIYYRLAQALANEDRHKEASRAYRDAIKNGGLKDDEEVQFWLGISLLQLQEWPGAISAFKAAAKDKTRKKSTRQYIKYIEGEKLRLAALKDMLEG